MQESHSKNEIADLVRDAIPLVKLRIVKFILNQLLL